LTFEFKRYGAEVLASIRNEGTLIDVDFGVVLPVIADNPSATINGVSVDVTTEIIKGRYTRIMTRFPLDREELLDKTEVKKVVFKMEASK